MFSSSGSSTPSSKPPLPTPHLPSPPTPKLVHLHTLPRTANPSSAPLTSTTPTLITKASILVTLIITPPISNPRPKSPVVPTLLPAPTPPNRRTPVDYRPTRTPKIAAPSNLPPHTPHPLTSPSPTPLPTRKTLTPTPTHPVSAPRHLRHRGER